MVLTAGTPDPAAVGLVAEAGVEVRVAEAVG